MSDRSDPPQTGRLTRDQKKAVTTLSRAVSVTGEAGSGKAEVVARRFCHILERGRAGVEEILVLAFTERAAREIKARIARQLAALGRRHDRHALESANIVTVHGFCSRALRENAFEAAVDPGFSLLGDVRQRVMADRVLGEVIEAASANPAAAVLIGELGPDAAKEAILSAYRQIRVLGRDLSTELIAPVSDPMPFLETFERCYNELLVSEEVPDYLLARIRGGPRTGLDRALESAERLASSPGGLRFAWKDFRWLKRYRGRFKASHGTRAARQQVKAARDALTDFLAACLDGESAIRVGLLLGLIADFAERYTSAKARLGLLDYDDLLDKTRALLCDGDGGLSEAARRYRDKFKFVMLGGFQDIGCPQREIIEAVSRPGGLFAVGDEKQAIFGFMHGGIREDSELAKPGRQLSIHLRENFRSRRGITDFVNYLFGEVWGEDRDIEFRDLKPAGRLAEETEPAVEIIVVPRSYEASEDGSFLERGRQNEAAAIARRILEITRQGGGTREDGAGRPISFGDIVVLLRSTADVQIYERALEEHGIGACIVSGRGFYSTPEVQTILCLLQAVDNPLDDTAMASVLASPFAGISEDSLLDLCTDGSAEANGEVPPDESAGRLWQALGRLDDIPRIGESDRLKLSAFRALLDDLMAIRSEVGIAGILELALDKSRFDVRLLAARGGRRKYGNVQRLCEIAREFAASGVSGLSDFIAHVRELGRLADRETETAAEGGPGNVRIMTIHRAKGIQSPVVFLADMSRRLGPRPESFVFDPDFGLAAQVGNPLTGGLEVPLCHRELAERLRERAMSEEKRLLYAAATRAQKRLILVGSSDLRGEYKSTYRETNSWMGWLEKAFELGPGSSEGRLAVGGCRVTLKYSLPSRVEAVRQSERPTLAAAFARELQEGRPIDRSDIPPAALEIARAAVERCLGDRPPITPSVPRLSVSRVLDYLECPARYRLLHVVGMPEQGGEPLEDAEEVGFGAADLGHLVHDLLSSVDFSGDVERQLQALVSGVIDETLRARIGPMLEGFAGSSWCADLRASERVLKETPFELAVGGKVLAGRIDALYRGMGGWTILDYKTGRAETRERYELQVGIYACAVHRLLGEMPARTGLLLLSTGGEWVQDTSDGSAARIAAEKVSESAAAIESGRFDPSPGAACEWCTFTGRCR